ncbi:MAG: pilus assembly protein [Alcaligenaceae bacterium]|nr:pilus assembly protein [Alcaligenaceae bacterium]
MLTLFFFHFTKTGRQKNRQIQQRKNGKQSGLGSVEFLLIAAPVLLLGLGSIETAYWYISRQAGNLALLEAARSAATHHGNPASIEQAFEKALFPLFASSGSFAGPQQRMQAYFASVTQKTGLTPWRIVIQSPTQADFNHFKRSDLAISQQTGLPAIDNNYQYEQYQRMGKAIQSGRNIYQANTLLLELTYAYKPLVPGVSQLFKMLAGNTSDYARQLQANGMLPIKHSLSVSMQSHPVLWPASASGKVIYAHDSQLARTTGSILQKNDACAGLWCNNPLPPAAGTPQAGLPHSPASGNAIPGTDTQRNTGTQGNTDTVSSEQQSGQSPEETLLEQNDPACGVTLCCT